MAMDQVVPMPALRQGQTSRPTGMSLGQVPLARKSVLIIEDEALIAMGFESCLQHAGAVVKIANSITSAQSALEEGIPFDAAVVEIVVADENASPLIQVLLERGIPVVITTGYEADWGQPALGKAVALLQKPHANGDLVNTITRLVN
jgi:DNA-binding NtrC family response regulator